MTIIIKDRVKQFSTTLGSGQLTLSTVPNGYVGFSEVFASGDTTYYCIENRNEFEIGLGTYGVGGANTLSRDTVLNSSTGASLALSGRSTIFVTVPAARFPFVGESGELNLALTTLNDVSLTAPASGESLKYNGSSWVNGVVAGYTTEEAQDAVGGILTDTSSVSFSYNDGAPSIAASVRSSGITDVMISGGIDATKIGSGSVSSTEFGYLDGVTSSLQVQLDSKYGSANPSGYLTASVASATYQPLDSDLTSIASTGVDSYGIGLLTKTSGSGVRNYIGAGTSSFDGAYGSLSGVPSTFAPSAHTHGNITNAGAIGSTTGLPIVTTASGVLTAGSFGTTAGTFAAGDDSRITGALSTSTAAATYAVIAAGQPISGTVGQVLAKNSGTNYDSSWTSLVLGDRYLSTSTTSNAVSNGTKTFTIGTGLAYTPTQNITIAYDATNHMHGEVTTYNSGTGVLVVDINNHTGTGTYTSWVVNVGGVTPATVVSWGDIIGTLGTQSDLSTALNAKLEITTAASTYLPLAGGTLTGPITGTSNTVQFRSSTTAQLVEVFNTYTSATSLETFRVKANAGSAYQIGSAKGSAGGSNQAVEVGHWDAAGAFTSAMSVGTTGLAVFSTGISLFSGFNTGFFPNGNTRFVSRCNNTVTNYFDATLGLFSGNGGEGWALNLNACSRTVPTVIPRTNSTTTGIGGDPANGILSLIVNGVERLAVASTGSVTIPQSVNTSGSPTVLTITGAAHTTLTLSTEATDVNFNLARTVQFATGAITTQRAMRIQAPTYSFVGASTITTASTLSISGPPVAGTNATITSAYALNIESGNVYLAGNVRLTANCRLTDGNGSGFGLASTGLATLYYYTFPILEIGNGTVTSYATLGIGSPLTGSGTAADTIWYRDGAGIFAQRNSTNAQTLRVYNTYTSSTSFENLQFKAVAGAAYQIGSAIGSAGGSNRAIQFGHSDGAGTFTDHFVIGVSDGVRVGGTGGTNNFIQLRGDRVSTGEYGVGYWNASDATILYTYAGRTLSIGHMAYGRASYTPYWSMDAYGGMSLTSALRTTGSPTAFILTGAAHTTLTLSTEATDVNFNLSRTVQFATGALTTQRAMRIQAPTYGFVGASTITTASTLSISGPPVAGTNATITNAYALNVESGNIKLAGHIVGTSMSVTPQSAYPTIYASNTFNSVGFWCSGDSVGTCYGGGVFMNYAHTNPGATCSFGYNTDIVLGTDATYAKLRWGTSLSLGYDAAQILAQRNSTNAQTFRLYNTYTSATSFETLQFKSVAASAYQIGSAIGSAGGTNRAIAFGHWNTAGTFVGTAGITTAATTYGGRFSDDGGLGNGAEQFGANTTTCIEGLAVGAYATAGIQYGTAIGCHAYAGYFSTSLGRNAGTSGTSGGFPSANGFNYCITISDGTDNVAPTASSQLLIAGLWTEAYFGKKVTHATPLDVRFNATGGSGTNIAGASFTLAGGKGTGTGAGGSLKFQVAPVGSSGSSLNSLVDALVIDSTKTSTFSGGVVVGTTFSSLGLVKIKDDNSAGGLSISGSTSPSITFYDGTPTLRAIIGIPTNGGAFLVDSGGGDLVIRTELSTSSTLIGVNTGGVTSTLKVANAAVTVAGVLNLQNSTTVTTLNLHTTYTSTTSYERFNIKGKAAANFEIGPENGSAGGTLRGLTLGGYTAGSATITPWLTFTNAGAATFAGAITASNLSGTNTGDQNLSSYATTAAVAAGYVALTGTQTVAGVKTFTSSLTYSADGAALSQTYKCYNPSTANGTQFLCQRARGSAASPLYPASGDVLLGLYGYGWDENLAGFSLQAHYICSASAAWTTTPISQGTQWTWGTTDPLDIATVNTNRMRLHGDGSLTLGSIASTGGLFQLVGTNTAATGLGTATNRLRFTDIDTSVLAGQPIGEIEFYSADASPTPPGAGARACFGAYTESSALATAFVWGLGAANAPPSEVMRLTSTGRLGLGTEPGGGAVSAFLHVISTSLQMRVGYDVSNYYTTTVSSGGAITFEAVGASAGFTFSDPVTLSSTSTATGLLTTTAGIKTTKTIYQTTETTSTPAAGAVTINLTLNNHQTLSLTSLAEAGTSQVTFTPPTGSSAGTLIVKQHATASKDITTWGVTGGTIKWMGTEPNWVGDAATNLRVVSWRWDGSILYLAATDVGT